MNYLAHFVLNHDIWRLPAEPYFVTGVVLPDLWLRFSRQRRIRWRAVRAALPSEMPGRQLRAGLLNHAEVDRRFHVLPEFYRWQRELRQNIDGDGVHPTLLDFLAHAAVELALDHHLLCYQPDLVDRFYGVIAAARPEVVAAEVGGLAAVDSSGLEEVLRSFVARRFLRRYASAAGLADVLRIVLHLADIAPVPDDLLRQLTRRAVALVRPAAVWSHLPPPTCTPQTA